MVLQAGVVAAGLPAVAGAEAATGPAVDPGAALLDSKTAGARRG